VTTFIPALIAVLLAETGARSAVFARLPRLSLASALLGLAVGAAAFGGFAMAPTMTPHARALLLGLVLMLVAFDQFGAVAPDPPASIPQTLLLVWRCSPPSLAFAFALWKSDPFGAAAGALAGFVGAVFLTSQIPGGWNRRVGLFSVTVIAIFGAYFALWALRLIA
jgi:hypothetical protein